MPLLMTKKVDRHLLYLNEGAFAIYIESSDKKSGDPWVRWARNFDRCLPLTMWEHFYNPLVHTTVERDIKTLQEQSRRIYEVLRQGRVLAFPGDEYTTALDKLKDTSPTFHSKVSALVQGLSNL